MSDDHYVYVLSCADGSLYTGYTTDPERRVAEHDAGEGAKYTRGRTPVELVHVERFDSRSAAMSREHEIIPVAFREGTTRRGDDRLVGRTTGLVEGTTRLVGRTTGLAVERFQ